MLLKAIEHELIYYMPTVWEYHVIHVILF